MMRVVRFVAVLFFVYAVNGRPSDLDDDDYDLNVAEPEMGIQNDNYEYDTDDDEPEIPDPVFITRPQDFIATENETVHLPCQLENGDTVVFMWKKNNDIIFQDTIKFNSFGNNFKVLNRTLIISNVGLNETANYTCSIPLSETEHLDVTHRLFVRTAPKIVSLRAQHDIVQLDAGRTLVLTCKAIGFPQPKIKWSRKGHRIDNEGETVTIENISHRDAGDYQCLADNNIEPPAHQFIHIGVAHKPVVKIEKLTVNTDEKLDTELICYVHAVPKADVVWQKDGLNIISSDRRHLKNFNHTHILEIKNVERADFGVYTCTARNRVGKSDENVTLTTYPSPAEHVRTIHDPEKNVLIWKLESKAPITKYNLEYKKVADSDWKSIAPEITNPDGNTYTVNYTLANIPSGHYEAKVRSKNTYGWSDWSAIVKFKSVEHHNHHNHRHHITDEQLTPEQSTMREEIIYQPKPQEPIENEVFNTEKPIVMQITQAPVVEIMKEHKENTEQTPQTQERQHQAAKEGNKPDGATAILPMIPLLCIALYTTLYSR